METDLLLKMDKRIKSDKYYFLLEKPHFENLDRHSNILTLGS